MRDVVRYVEPYDPGLFPQDIIERYGIDRRSVINLASNESAFSPPARVVEAVQRALKSVNRYPDPKSRRLKAALSKAVGVDERQICVGAGATQLLDTACKIFLDPLDLVAMPVPTYSLYVHLAMLREARLELVETSPPDFSLDVDSFVERAKDAKMTFICSPNNPTGSVVERAALEEIAESCHGVVVVDEAYADFTRQSACDLVQSHPNLIVIRSMSKYLSLAGLRVGYAVADEEVASTMEKVRLPFSVSSLAEEAAVAALSSSKHYERAKNRIVSERDWLLSRLKSLDGIEPVPSHANFILVKVNRDVPHLVELLGKKGVLIRDLAGVIGLHGHYVRITVGTRNENLGLLQHLSAALEPS